MMQRAGPVRPVDGRLITLPDIPEQRRMDVAESVDPVKLP
jgi:hypothetical protein